jgi:uncharacterized protein involved in exopolysaccharide biosynthesis
LDQYGTLARSSNNFSVTATIRTTIDPHPSDRGVWFRGICLFIKKQHRSLNYRTTPIVALHNRVEQHRIQMNNSPQSFLSLIAKRKWWIILPTIFMTTAAVGYALLKPDYWNATQALFVRDEVAATGGKLGSFQSTDAMQTAQETILEVALHHNTLREALVDVGPRKSLLSIGSMLPGGDSSWPSDTFVDDFRKMVSVSAPNGAKFGRTEMIYVGVKARGKQRAVELTDAVVDRLMERMKKLREAKYTGIIAEIEKTISVAKADHEDALQRMTEIEQALGSNVAELRTMTNGAQGDGILRRDLVAIRADLRKAKAEYEQKLLARQQLFEAQNDPQRLITMPNRVLDTQPSLKRLKEGLVDAQLKAANLKGQLSLEHPFTRAAVNSVQRIQSQLLTELRVAIRTLDGDLKSSGSRLAGLLQQMQAAESSLSGLSDVRSEYARLDAEVIERTKFLEKARQDLSTARSNQIAATNVSLVQRVDNAIPGSRPLGPGGKMIVLAGMLAGLMTGLGLVYLFEGDGRDFGRRYTDNSLGRRRQDQTAETIAAAGRRDADNATGVASYPFWPKGRRTADKSGSAQPAPAKPAVQQPAVQQNPQQRPPQQRPPQAPPTPSTPVTHQAPLNNPQEVNPQFPPMPGTHQS